MNAGGPFVLVRHLSQLGALSVILIFVICFTSEIFCAKKTYLDTLSKHENSRFVQMQLSTYTPVRTYLS